MCRRTVLLVLSLSCLLSLAAAAAPPPGAAPAPAAISVAAPAPAVPDTSWLARLDVQRSVAPALSGSANDSFEFLAGGGCLLQCIKNGGDPICCAYTCHPVGEDPC